MSKGEDSVVRQGLHIPALDTLRALAVIAVFGYHLAAPGFRGGYLGVTLFFVISGYLITRLLLKEAKETEAIDLIGFWTRRLRRLVPALYLVIVVTITMVTVVAPSLLSKTRGDGLAALAYVGNWWTILHQVPYFDSFGLPSPLAHLWSLAIEEQFYLVWPLMLAGILIFARTRRRMLVIVGAMIVGSSLAMALLYRADDLNRSYMGTDTRAAELLIGAFLAIALHYGHGHHDELARRTRWFEGRAAGALLIGSAAVWIGLVVGMPGDWAGAYRGGLLLAALASAGVIFACMSRSVERAATVCDRSLVGAVGRRSYSIYLWHYPVIVALSTADNFDTFSWSRTVFAVAATGLCAELSYRLVEGPIRRRGFRITIAVLMEKLAGLQWRYRSAVGVMATSVAGLAVLPLFGFAPFRQPDHGPEVVVKGEKPEGAPSTLPIQPPITMNPRTNVPPPTLVKPRAPSASATKKVAKRPPMVGANTVAIGDSLMIDISGVLGAALPRVTINAEVGRQPWTGLAIAKSYGQFNNIRGTYILGIGTNGAINQDMLIDFCTSHPTPRILLITPRLHRSWEAASISSIWMAAKRCSNVRVVDFHQAAANHPEYFADDGVHLTEAGDRAMVALIIKMGRSE